MKFTTTVAFPKGVNQDEFVAKLNRHLRTTGPKELRYIRFVHIQNSIHFQIEYDPGSKEDAVALVEAYLGRAYKDIEGQDYTLELFSFTVESEVEREALEGVFKNLNADWSKLAPKSPGVWNLVQVPDSQKEVLVSFSPDFLASERVRQLIHVIASLTVADSPSKQKDENC